MADYTSSVIRTLHASALMDERFTRALSAVHGISLRELMLMRYVRQAPGEKLTRVDLARMLCVSASTVTRATRPLEKIGLIGREADGRDARLSYVVLTPTGKRRVKEAEKSLEQMSDEFLSSQLSKPELSRLNTMLAKVCTRLGGPAQPGS